jgi:hypothetical protein
MTRDGLWFTISLTWPFALLVAMVVIVLKAGPPA